MSSASTHEMDQIRELTETSAERGYADQLEGVIAAKTYGNIQNLRVHLRQGVATITGQAKSYTTKQLATHAIINDVMRVLNEIEVL
jgi:hypothetical protein